MSQNKILIILTFCYAFIVAKVGHSQSELLKIVTEEPYYFEAKNINISFGIGIGSNLNIDSISNEVYNIETKVTVPALTLNAERQVYQNLGVGINLGYQKWTAPEYEYSYNYFTGGLMARYHFNAYFLKHLDPYFGIGALYRSFNMSNTQENSIRNNQIRPSVLFGARYYIQETVGAYMEVGTLGNTTFNFGLVFYLQKLYKLK